MGQKPDCVLCPNKGGAMKSTRSGQKWAHVSCALWIPEVSIGSVDRMEPITKISSIPQSRWALLCVLCRERVGACIQCSVKTCKTAYHVTCAFQHGLEMRAIIEDENAEDGVKLRSYCQKHSVNNKNKKESKTSANKNIEKDISSTTTTNTTNTATTTAKTTTTTTVPPTEDEEKTCKKRIRKEMTSEERNQARMARLQEIEGEFDKHVSIRDISCHLLDVDQEGINHIYSYWILKRKAGGNKPLLLPKTEDVDVLTQTDQEQADIEKMKMFVHLRQDLERVRNLCYMVSRREKLSRSFFKMREQIFHKQMAVLSRNKNTNKLDENVIESIVEANHGPSIYDVLYSSDTIIKDQTKQIKIEVMIDSILGNNLNSKSNTSNKLATDINGSTKKMDASSRYSKIFNGGTGSGANRKYSLSDSLSSDTDNSSRRRRNRRKMGHNNSSSAASTSSATTDDERRVARKSPVKFTKPSPVPAASPVVKKKVGRPSLKATETKKRKTNSVNSSAEKNKSYSMDSSSEDELKQSNNSKQQKTPAALPAAKPRSTKVRQRDDNDDENNMHLTDESDELIPIKNSSGYNIPTTANIKRIESSAIYSDSDDSSSSDKDNKTDHTVSDSQQQPLRTKAAMKEFSMHELTMFMKKNEAKKNASEKKSAAVPKKPLPPPRTEAKITALTAPVKARRASTKLTTWSDSEKEEEEKEAVVKPPVNSKEKEPSNTNHKKNASKKEKDQHTDLLVVPQREAAKKASENLMKTNSALMVQSISATNTEKHRKDAREKLDETLLLKNISDSERENQKQTKEVTPKRNKSSKDTKKSTNKEEKKQKEREKEEADREKQREKDEADREKQREKDDKLQNEIPSDVHAYVPQRQAAKKAAEHIKGLGKPGDASQVQAVASFDEKEKEKSKTTPSTPVSSKKREMERRKSTVIDLSSSSTSSSSSNSDSGSSGSSDSGEADSPKTKTPIKNHATTSANKTLTATAGLKLKTKDSPFLDKVPKSSATVPTSSSSDSSTDSDSSTSDRPSSARLPDKSRTTSKKKSVGESVVSPTKKQSNVVSSNKKSSSITKVENDKLLSPPPPRRSSIATKSTAAAPTKRTETEKVSTPSRRKSMAVSVDQEQTNSRSTSKTTTTKVSSNKSKTAESSKGDLVKVSDKRKTSTDVKEIATPPRTSDTLNKKRKSSINALPLSPNHQSSEKEPKIDSKAAKENKEKHSKDKEISSEVVFRRSSRSDSMASKTTNISSSTTTKAIENKIDSPVKQKEITTSKMKPPAPTATVAAALMKVDSSPDVIEIADESESEVPNRNARNNIKSIPNEKKIESKTIKDSAMEIDDEAIVAAVNVVEDKATKEDSPAPNDMKVITPMPSPVNSQKTSSTLSMVSIPTANLNLSKENDSNSIGDLGNDMLENAAAISAEINQVFGDEEAFNRTPSFLNSKDPFMVNKEDAKEDTERETYNLIEKLRQKNKKLGSSNSITENNNTISDKTPNRDFNNEQSPSLLIKASPNDRNVLKSNENTNKSSPCANNRVITNKTTPQHEGFEQQQMKIVQDNCPQITKKEHNQISSPYIQQQNQSNENNFNLNRNLTNTTNNSHKQNVSLGGNNILSPTSSSLPPSTTCMVVEQQQKQQQQQQMQRMGEENCLAASNPFMTPLQMMQNPNDQMNSALSPMDMFNIHLQHEQNQKWQPNAEQLKSKLKMLQQHHPAAAYNMLKRNQDIESMLGDQQHQLHHQKQNIGNDYTGLGNMQANFLQNTFHYTENAPQYPGAVSLFPPSGMNVQVPFPSPGQAMFPPNFGNSFSSSSTHQNSEHSMMMHKVNADLIANSNNLQYGAQNLCGTASSFTSQQHQESVLSLIQKATQEQTMIRNLSPPSFTNKKNDTTDRRNSSEKQTRQNESKRSPMKSTRASPRNTTPTHNKTPQKSPSKSPRQPPTVEPVYARQSSGNGKNKITQSTENSKQKKGRANSQASPASTGTPTSTSSRGKGRGRGRGRGGAIAHQQPFMQPINDFDFNSMGTINQKLVGTVYDFSADDEIMHPGVENLRAMRDRRKSVDLYNKMNRDGSTTAASSESPKFSSKSSMKSSSLAVNNHTMTNNIITPVPSSTLPDMNLVNMPGPVDMRTYSTNFDTNDNNYNSQLLGAFATNTVDQTLNEIDEEQEKELQTALKASNDKQKTPTTTTVIETPAYVEVTTSFTSEQHVEESVDSDASFPKVSLSDSRNQLKLKIKGPLAHPDMHHTHSTSSLLTQQQAEINPHHQILVTPQANITGGSSNRRMPQMRKKELLRQYWTQDMNMDHEQSSIMQSVDQTTNMTINTQTSRIAGIPKAVDSMGSYLMKDDYKEINYAEFKKRKKISMRELRQLDIYPMDVADMAASGDLSENNDDEDPLSITTKRRNRPTRGAQLNNLSSNPPSKLKIKIGSDMMETMGASGDLPPKKRLSNTTTRPNFVDLKRESMNFRKQMMFEFGDKKKKEHRTKEEKRERKEKKKKKKDKKREMKIISQPSDAPTKLIIRIGNKSTTTATSSPKNSTSTSTHSTDIANNSNTPDNLNKSIPITPLRLKIARNSQGNGQSYTLSTKESTVVNAIDKSIDNFSIQSPMTTIIEGAKMVTSTPLNNTSNNNNLSILQPPIIDASSINTLTTKKLEVTLNRIDDVIVITKPTLASKKQMTSTPSNDDVANLTTPASNSIAHNDCEVR